MRLLVRLLAALLGLLLAAAGALLVIEVLWALLRPDTTGLAVPWRAFRATLTDLTWNGTPMRVAAGIAVAIGVLLLLAVFTAGRKDLRLHDPAPEVTVITDRQSLARLVGHQTRKQDGVERASVTATGRRVRIKARSKYRSAGDLRERLVDTGEHTVDELPLQRKPTMSVSVSSAKEKR